MIGFESTTAAQRQIIKIGNNAVKKPNLLSL